MRHETLSTVSSGSSNVHRNHWEEVRRKGYRWHFWPGCCKPTCILLSSVVSVYFGDMFCLIL